MLFVFDFDGVLYDTARECLAIAYETVRRLTPALFREETPSPEVTEQFLANRHWVGPPWQYAVLLDCIARRDLPRTTVEFLALAEREAIRYSGFTESYFATRGELAADVARWCSVVTPYDHAVAMYRRLHADGTAAILSTRDDASIRKMMLHFTGIQDPVLLPRAGARPKADVLADAAAQRGLSLRRLFFLDDYVHHALPAFARGVAAHLALWGYSSVDDLELARSAALPCLHARDLEPAISRHLQENP